MTDEQKLDGALKVWAKVDPTGAGDGAALSRILAHADAVAAPVSSGRPWWVLGGAIAASMAIALLVAPRPEQPAAADRPLLEVSATGDGEAAFGLLYTPLVEEEYQP